MSQNFQDHVIVLCVRWYLRYCLTLRVRDAVYTRAPQRARLAEYSNRLFRHRLEQVLIGAVKQAGEYRISTCLDQLMALDTLPLPLFFLDALRGTAVTSPQGILQEAREKGGDQPRSL